jgi:CheY-like chemotaxis protein
MHILFVDDTSETRDLFQLCFTAEGHAAQTAHSGQDALRVIEESAGQLDVIIMDYHMWGMTGLEVVRHLREMKDVPPIPVILYTSDENSSVDTEAEELGVVHVVRKPALPTQLIELARQFAK